MSYKDSRSDLGFSFRKAGGLGPLVLEKVGVVVQAFEV